jgi:hypothetical protein
VKHPRHAHEVTISPQTLECRTHGVLVLVDIPLAGNRCGREYLYSMSGYCQLAPTAPGRIPRSADRLAVHAHGGLRPGSPDPA